MNNERLLKSARESICIQAESIKFLENQINSDFEDLCKKILKIKGKLILMGVGKSGHIAEKISATLASTGTPSFFIHPTEAAHGDLGMIDKNDLILIFSNSGETNEIISILPALRKKIKSVCSITNSKKSSIAKASDIHIEIKILKEACPHNLAPTTSTMITMVLGDALAVSLMELKNFKQEDFALTHPGGSLGKRLLSSVKDEMKQNNLPFIDQNSIVQDVLVKMTEGRLGLALVGTNEELKGVITDGDIRRALIDNKNFAELKAKDLMNTNPLTALESDNLQVAEKRMREAKVQCLIVKNLMNEVVGVIQIFE